MSSDPTTNVPLTVKELEVLRDALSEFIPWEWFPSKVRILERIQDKIDYTLEREQHENNNHNN